MKKPNLFKFATSELSQDAFICWLLSWGNYSIEDPLNKTAKFFISKLTNGKIKDFKEIEVHRQYNKIDIVAIIDNEWVILIEDKTNTKDHSNQLQTYLKHLSTKHLPEKIFPLYCKTGDQSDFSSPKKAGYSLFLRKEFLEILEYGIEQGVQNEIFLDFFTHLSDIESSVQSYKSLPLQQWKWNSWKGFYSELQERLGMGNWDYVPQKNGGFLGFWWFWKIAEVDGFKYEYYLQLEQNKFCFKLYPHKREVAEKVRNHYRSKLFEKANELGVKVFQNGRIGNSMTVAALTNSYIATNQDGFLDFEKTILNIKNAENLLCKI